MNTILLEGCRPEPLMSYLKALGIFRLIAEQIDPKIKSYWQGNTFAIQTQLNEQELINFFCDQYIPTPIVSPWNGGSGFYGVGDKGGLDAILKSDDSRFQIYRQTINDLYSWPEIPKYEHLTEVIEKLEDETRKLEKGKKRNELLQILQTIKDAQKQLIELQNIDGQSLPQSNPKQISLSHIERMAKTKGSSKKKYSVCWNAISKGITACDKIERDRFKSTLLTRCRSHLPEATIKWIDAVCAIRPNDKPGFNPLLGSGGNEGNLEYSNNFMEHLSTLFFNYPSGQRLALLRVALQAIPIAGLIKSAIGQFDPGRAGGFNQGSEIETKNFTINPWDFVLMMEGSLVLACAAVRRNTTSIHSYLASPFTVQPSTVGFDSSSQGEREKSKAEIWLPIWNKPAQYAEMGYLFGEGRCTNGRRPAKNGLDFSRALRNLGVNRGLSSFVRYSILIRRGQSNIALPSGRPKVNFKPEIHILNELDSLLEHLDRFLREFETVPASFKQARHQIDEAIFACCEDPNPKRFIQIIRALGRMEMALAHRKPGTAPSLSSPLWNLSPKWINQCDDGASEIRIAAALASIQKADSVGPLRSNLTPVDPQNPWKWAVGHGQQLWVGNSLAERLGNVLKARVMEAEKSNIEGIPLRSWLSVVPEDAMRFLLGETDDHMIEELLFGFSLIKWQADSLTEIRQNWNKILPAPFPLSRQWCLIKLLFSPRPLRSINLKKEPRIIALLQANRITEACHLAQLRIRTAGLNPIQIDYPNAGIMSERLLAALLIPTSDYWKLESLVLEETKPNN